MIARLLWRARFALRVWLGTIRRRLFPPGLPPLPRAFPEIAPPGGFDDWFVWECVEYTRCPFAFWLDPWRFDFQPSAEQQRKAQDAVAALYGLAVLRDRHGSIALTLRR